MNDGRAGFGYGRVHEHLQQVAERSPDQIVQHFLASGDTWMNGVPQADDMTLMVIKMKRD